MKRWNLLLRRKLVIPLVLVSLTLSTILIVPASGLISKGKTDDFEYYSCSPSGWHKYVRFTVVEWNSTDEIAIIRVTTETTIETTNEDYRLKIPEWSIIAENGTVIDNWPYCPIWLDSSELTKGFVFEDPEYWLFNFTVDLKTTQSCDIQRTTPGEGYNIIQCLYYDVETQRIEQYDYHTKYPDNTVYTIRLMYLSSGWNFATTPSIIIDSSLTFLLLAGIFVEIVIIILIIARRLSKQN